jgi:hypothetical protein
MGDRYRPHMDPHMLVMVICPIAPITMPITIVFVMPVIIIPVVISMILVRQRRHTSADDRSEHCNC